MHLLGHALSCLCLQVIDPCNPQLLDQSQESAQHSHAHLSQDYRAQPDGGASASDDDLGGEVSDVDAEELKDECDDEEDGGPSTWLEDPPQGDADQQRWPAECLQCCIAFALFFLVAQCRRLAGMASLVSA